jgi:hypothetical protein
MYHQANERDRPLHCAGFCFCTVHIDVYAFEQLDIVIRLQYQIFRIQGNSHQWQIDEFHSTQMSWIVSQEQILGICIPPTPLTVAADCHNVDETKHEFLHPLMD